jgi:hypothetical protein
MDCCALRATYCKNKNVSLSTTSFSRVMNSHDTILERDYTILTNYSRRTVLVIQKPNFFLVGFASFLKMPPTVVHSYEFNGDYVRGYI